MQPLPNDPMWPRAGHWITSAQPSDAAPADLGILGVPAHRSSITPTHADTTPSAVREALLRYSTYGTSSGIDVRTLRAVDFGDVEEPDGAQGEERVRSAVALASRTTRLLIAIGGDNSITFPLVTGLFADRLAACGLVTVDAHHDLRDGETNGSPVRRIVEAGMPGSHIVQIGIADFSNSAAHAERARDLGITVVPRAALRTSSLENIVGGALEIAGAGGRPVFVDIDVDVCDRAEVPGCPSAAPGGISADELRHIARLVARDARVAGIDITEIDASADSADQRTVRLAALLVLEAAAGLAQRAGA